MLALALALRLQALALALALKLQALALALCLQALLTSLGSGDSWSYKTCKHPVRSPPPTNSTPDALTVAQPTVSQYQRRKPGTKCGGRPVQGSG